MRRVFTAQNAPAPRFALVVDGNKRLALAATIVFLGVNGRKLTLSDDQAYELVMTVASGEPDDIADLADRLRVGTQAR